MLRPQVSFVETPKFSFNTKVYGGDLSYLPGLDEYIDWCATRPDPQQLLDTTTKQ